MSNQGKLPENIIKSFEELNLRYYNSYNDLYQHTIEHMVDSKKEIINLVNKYRELNLQQELDTVIDYIVHQAGVTNSKLQHIYCRTDRDSCINLLTTFIQINQKTPNFIPKDKLNKDLFNAIFSNNISRKNIDSYFYLHKLGLVNTFPISTKIGIEHFEPNKRSLNLLIDILIFEKNEDCLAIFSNMFHLVRSNDPELVGVKLDSLLKEVENVTYNEELRNKIKGIIQQDPNEIFKTITNTFSILFEIDKITVVRKSKNLYGEDGTSFIIKMDEVLLKEKQENILFCDSYVDRKEEKEKIQFHSKESYTKTNRILAEALKRFDFHYSNSEDMEKKLTMFKVFFNQCMSMKISQPTDVFIDLLKKITFKEHLMFNLEDNTTTKRKNKI